MTPAMFVARKPEFSQTSDPRLSLALSVAAGHISKSAFGVRYDDALAELTAHLLWSGPFGATTRLDSEPEPAKKSRYWKEYRRIAAEVIGPRMFVL